MGSCPGDGSSGAAGDEKIFSAEASVDHPQDRPHLRVLQHIFPQQVLLFVAGVGQLRHSRKGQMAVGVQTDGDTQGIIGQVTFKLIITGDMEGPV